MPSRRRLLATLGAASTASLAGCRSVLGGGNRKQWERSFPHRWHVESPLVLVDGTLYALAGDGWLSALDAANGETQWENRFRRGAQTGPRYLRRKHRLYVGSDDLVVLNVMGDGWDVAAWVDEPLTGVSVTALATAERRALVGTSDARLHSVRVPDARPEWSLSLATAVPESGSDGDAGGTDAETGNSGDGDATVREVWQAGDRTLALAGTRFAGTVTAVDPRGSPAWESSVRAPFDGTLAGETLVLAHAESLTAFDVADGSVRWTRSPGPLSSLGTDGEAVYAASEDPAPSLAAFDLESGEKQWETPTAGVTPRGLGLGVADDHVYVPESGAGRVGAYTAGGETAWTYEFDTDGEIHTRPLRVFDSVYVGVDQRVLALDAE